MPNGFIVKAIVEVIEDDYCVRLNNGELVEVMEGFSQYSAKKKSRRGTLVSQSETFRRIEDFG